MRLIKVMLVLGLIYVGIVVTFESLLGYFQPADAQTMVITTFDADGVGSDRVVARLETDSELYVAANHWPRAWFRTALANDRVEITFNGVKASYKAVLLEGAEHDRINADHALPLGFRILTGFPPRYLMRLEPQ